MPDRDAAANGEPASTGAEAWPAWERIGANLPLDGAGNDRPNLLIQGDNGQAMRRLAAEFAGAVDLVYIDPPFFTGDRHRADVLGAPVEARSAPGRRWRAVAYKDIWGRMENYLDFMAERLELLRTLLSDRGTIYVHCDWRASHYLRLLMDELFGPENFRNEIIWCYRGGGVPRRDFAAKHDTILRYSKTGDYRFFVDRVRIPYSDDVQGSPASRYDKSYRDNKTYSGYRPHDAGKHPEDWWAIQPLMPSDTTERAGYPTQKPVELLQRIVDASSEPGSLVLDAFCGSGTTLAVAAGLRAKRRRLPSGKEKLSYHFAEPRRWIGVDQSPLAIHVTRKRLTALNDRLAQSAKRPCLIETRKAPPGELLPAQPSAEEPVWETPRLEARLVEAAVDDAETLQVVVEITGYSLRLIRGPGELQSELSRRQAQGALALMELWAVDPAWQEGRPFCYAWQAIRDAKTREMPLRSPPVPVSARQFPATVAVKAFDVFGNEALAQVDLPPLISSPIP